MKLFKCQHCDQLLYFENVQCLHCNHTIGYSWKANRMLTLTPTTQDRWQVVGSNKQKKNQRQEYVFCQNRELNACNWLIPAEDGNPYCEACQLNRTIPDLDQPNNMELWQKMEIAKHRLVYSLLRLGLPTISKAEDDENGLAFDFLAENGEVPEEVTSADGTVLTGHASGVITINLAEADDAKREQMRQSLAEPYRTLLGHLRHESAHYYWELFAKDPKWLEAFRNYFGDERKDYAQALSEHYNAQETDASTNAWENEYISAYASTHPWEDWAETWAHYLHIVDALETAYAFGLNLGPALGQKNLSVDVDFDAYTQSNFEDLIETWLPVTFAVNSLNRSIGQQDLYPFVLTEPVLEKMEFIHNRVHDINSRKKKIPGFSWLRKQLS